MANFTFTKYNSLPEQVQENLDNIKKLSSYIKDAFKTSLALNTTDSSIAISDTNADASTIDGWLFDAFGQLFKITSGDGTNLLIEFYSDLRGATGATGADGAQGDRGFSTRYCSQQISGTILVSNTNIYPNIDIQVNDIVFDDYANIGIVTDISGADVEISYQASFNIDLSSAKDKGTYFTTTQPTYDSGTGYYTLDEGHFENQNSNIPIKAFDLLIYIDSNDKVKDVYKVLNKVGSTWTLDKIGEIGSKQYYQHNVKVTKNGTINFYGNLVIVNDSATPFNLTSLKQYLTTKGYNDNNHRVCNGGYATNGSNLYVAESICIYDYYGDMVIRYYYANNTGVVQGGNDVANEIIVDDNVETI